MPWRKASWDGPARRTGWPNILLAAWLLLLAGACGPASAPPSTAPTALAALTETAAAGGTTTAGAATTVSPATLAVTAAPDAAATAAAGATGAAGQTPDPAVSATSFATPADSSTAAASSTPAASPTACLEMEGQFAPVDVPSPTLGYAINTLVYTPPCYAATSQAYPVLYLIHGLNYDESQWQRLGVGTAADQLIAAGQIAPLIIVLPRERGDLLFDPAFMVDLVPYIDSHYRTLASAGYRAIGGMSRGGGWSIHLGLRYPNVFGRVGAHSPAIFYGDETNVLRYLRAVAKTSIVPAVYIDVGSDDPQNQSAVWLDQMLTALRLPHTYATAPGGHDEAYWSAHLNDYLRFYAASWLPRPPASATPLPSATPTARPSPTKRPK